MAEMARTRRRQRGFSLLEMIVAVGILSLIMLGVAVTLKSTGTVSTLEATRNEMERTGQNALDRMALELRDAAARVVTVSADGTSIQFKVPVDLNGNGTILDGAGNIEFGFLDKGVPRSGTITYRFVQNFIGAKADVLSEAALHTKLNKDADVADRYDRGCIVRITQAAGWPAVTTPLSGRWIVQPSGNWGGDIDGDGTPDPIFKMDATNGRVLVNLWAMEIDIERNKHAVNCSTSISFRNK